MRTLLIAFAILQLVLGSCPDIGGFELVKDGECRGLHSRDNSYFQDAAQQAIIRCATLNGLPVIIHNEEHQSYWMNLAPPTTDGFLILGLVCNANSKKWEWADGSALDFKPPSGKYAVELLQPCVAGYSWDLHPDGYWSYGNEGIVSAAYFCTTQLVQAIPGAHGCDNFEDDGEDGVCYQVGTTAQSWYEAQLSCTEFGANLASIHNKQENDFIRRLAATRGATNGVFIGGTTRKDGSFGWIDGTKMDYENYFPGFPKKNFGDCIAMDTSSTGGQWMNTDCYTKMPVACIRPERTPSEPECSGQDYKEGEIMTSPGYPYSASTMCDWFLSAPAGKKVEITILVLEANLCCDSVIIYDGYIGAPIIAKVSGEKQNVTYTTKASNTMRVSWQPNGGVNVKGLAMTYRVV